MAHDKAVVVPLDANAMLRERFATTVSATASVSTTPATILSAGRVTHFRPKFRRHGPRLHHRTHRLRHHHRRRDTFFFTTQEKERNLPASLSLPRPQRCIPLRVVCFKAPTASNSPRTALIEHVHADDPPQPRNSPRATQRSLMRATQRGNTTT